MDDGTQGVLLADASNAFNVINRKTALVNLRYLCPNLSIFATNFYRVPTKLYLTEGHVILSSEGTTQGCNIASPFYSISIRPLLPLSDNRKNHLMLMMELVWGSWLPLGVGGTPCVPSPNSCNKVPAMNFGRIKRC